MNCRFLLVAALSLASLAFTACDGGRPLEIAPRNVVVIVLDTLRPDRLGSYGAARSLTPRLDALARDSFVFADAQSASPWTAPALISLMTSTYPPVHGVTRFPNPGRMPDSVPALAEILQERGWETGAFTEGGYAKGDFGLDRGFDVFARNEGDAESHISNLRHSSRLVENVDRSLSWMKRPREKPFFLLFHTYEPHVPYRPGEMWVRSVRPEWSGEAEREALAEIVERWNESSVFPEEEGLRTLVRHYFHCLMDEAPDPENRGEFSRRVRSHVEPFEDGQSSYDPATLSVVRDLYDAGARRTDRELARLLDALAELGIEEETIVVVVSDHGESLGQHGWVGHGSVLHDEALRIGLVLTVPGRTGRSIPGLVRSVDVAPTILDLLGIPPDSFGFQGESLELFLAGNGAAREAFSGALSRPGKEMSQVTVRAGRWRLVASAESEPPRLFDCEADPGELVDVARQHPDVVRRLASTLEEHASANRRRGLEAGTEVTDVELDESMTERLRALGYVDD